MGVLLALALVPAVLPGLACGDTGRSARNALVVFERSGGIAGSLDRLVIQPKGKARLTTRAHPEGTRFRVERRTLRRLRSLLDRAQLGTLDPSYEGEEVVRDDIDFQITHDGHTVQTAGTAAPPRLDAVLALLQRIVDRHGRRVQTR